MNGAETAPVNGDYDLRILDIDLDRLTKMTPSLQDEPLELNSGCRRLKELHKCYMNENKDMKIE